MRVVSGPAGRGRIHFEAPDAQRLDEEIKTFLKGFEGGANLGPVFRAAIAHLRFITSLFVGNDLSSRRKNLIIDSNT